MFVRRCPVKVSAMEATAALSDVEGAATDARRRGGIGFAALCRKNVQLEN